MLRWSLRSFTCLSLLLPVAASAAFSDVNTDTLYADGILYVQSSGIVSGYSDGTYRPEQTINRAEFTKIIVGATQQLRGITCDMKAMDYADVKDTDWFAVYVCIATEKGITGGYPDGTFRPSATINIAETSKILAESFDLTLGTDNSAWYSGYLQALASAGVIPASVSDPAALLTRGQMAEMIYRLETGRKSAEAQTAEHCHDGDCHLHDVSFESYCTSAGCSNVTITTDSQYRYITSNGLPSHLTGDFPNSGNPNKISEQSHSYRVTLNPVYSETATSAQVPGVALNGVFFEPGTAERNGSYSYEAVQDEINLGLDFNNAHVQPGGAYHYHSVPTSLIEQLKAYTTSDLIHIGWAADGHAIYYSLSSAYKSSYRIKSGSRSANPPGGSYDGTYTQDYEYVDGLGDLDDCNGTWIDDEYAYIATHSFPYLPRCLHGTADSSFAKGPAAGGMNQQGPPSGQSGPGGMSGPPNGGPPPEATAACSGKSDSTSCSFGTPQGTMSGSCRQTPDGAFACVPAR